MKTTILLYLIICASQLFAQPKSYDYAYINQKGICVYSNTDKKEYFILKDGADPCISPDGTKLAYTVNLKNGNRAITVIDLNTKAKISLITHNDNCYGPKWSPDGKWIAYNAFLGSKWSIAVIGTNNTGARLLGKNAEDVYSPEWLANSEDIMVQNSEQITVLDLQGSIINTYNPKDLQAGIPELKDMISKSSADRFILSGDSKKIAFNNEVNLPGKIELPLAVFIYDIGNKKTTRLSPKGYEGFDLIISGNKVLFTGYKGNAYLPNIYSVDMDGSNLNILFPGCSGLTAKN